MFRKISCLLLSAAVFVPFLIYAFACGLRGTAAPNSARFIELVPLSLDPEEAGKDQFGPLQLVGAFELRSADERFGGLSGAAMGEDGTLYFVSDKGYWLSTQPRFTMNRTLAELRDWRIGPLLTPQRTATRGRFTDAESVARANDGSFLVSFEQEHRIWRYPAPPEGFAGAAGVVPTPTDLRDAKRNGGL